VILPGDEASISPVFRFIYKLVLDTSASMQGLEDNQKVFGI
jgi:hypothetical protein